ncbi:MAG: hypothetical protein ABIJ61_10995, partial [bacterium]
MCGKWYLNALPTKALSSQVSSPNFDLIVDFSRLGNHNRWSVFGVRDPGRPGWRNDAWSYRDDAHLDSYGVCCVTANLLRRFLPCLEWFDQYSF